MRVRLVRRDDELDALGAQRGDELLHHLRRNADRLAAEALIVFGVVLAGGAARVDDGARVLTYIHAKRVCQRLLRHGSTIEDHERLNSIPPEHVHEREAVVDVLVRGLAESELARAGAERSVHPAGRVDADPLPPEARHARLLTCRTDELQQARNAHRGLLFFDCTRLVREGKGESERAESGCSRECNARV